LSTFSPHRSPVLSEEEWAELQALRKAISEAPFSIVPSKMERFSELFARTLQGKGDLPIKA